MEAIVGDETGLIKVVDVQKREFLTYGTQDRNIGVEGLSWLKDGYIHNEFAALRANSTLEVWKYETGSSTMLSSISLPMIEDPLAVSHVGTNRVVCVGKLGHVAVVKYNDETAVMNSKKKSATNWDLLKSFQVKGPVGAMGTCQGGAAFGGSENDVVMYDVATQQLTWSARNVPHDTLRLRVPIWVAAIKFLNPSSDSPSSAQFVTGTGYKHVRLYDIKAGQQPSFSIDTGGEYRVTSIQPTSDGNALFVADCSGGLGMWDLRMSRRKVSVLTGSSGSIRSMHLAPSGNHLASVGLDRFLRVYDTTKANAGVKDSVSGNRRINIGSKLMCAAYLKNRLNCCLLADNEAKKPKGPRKEKNRGEAGDDDTLKSDVNFDSEEEDDDDDEEKNNSDGEENEDDSEENNEMIIDDDDDDEEEEEGDPEDDEEEDEEDDESEGEGDEESSGSDAGDDNSESNDDGDDSDADRKGPGKGRYSSRKERVAHVAKIALSKSKASSSNSNGSKKRKL